MKPIRIIINYDEGSLLVTEQGVSFEGWDDDPLADGLAQHSKLYALVTQEFAHHKVVRDVLGLKKGESLHERMCPEPGSGVQ